MYLSFITGQWLGKLINNYRSWKGLLWIFLLFSITFNIFSLFLLPYHYPNFDTLGLSSLDIHVQPSCKNLCKSYNDKVFVDNENIAGAINDYFVKGEGTPINCWNADKVTITKIRKDFRDDVSCWNTSGVTSMRVSVLLKFLNTNTYIIHIF